MSEHTAEAHTHHPNYVKIWAILCVLLVISVIGPMFEIRVVTLITAFGIAVVKAYMVVKNFMHLGAARRYVTYLMVTCLLFMLLLFAGVAPDVMKEEGTQWEKPSWKVESAAALHGDAHGSSGHH